MDAKLSQSFDVDVAPTEDRIVSQWRELSGNEKTELPDKVDEILRPLGLQTELLVVKRANSLALFFLCMTLSALVILREQWSNGQLRHIIQSLFAFLSATADTLFVTRLTWPLTDYERCRDLFGFLQVSQNT